MAKKKNAATKPQQRPRLAFTKEPEKFLKIDKKVPIAAKKVERSDTALAKFLLRMDVGDSIFLKDQNEVVSVSNLFRSTAKKHNNGRKCVSRRVEGGFRVWRIK